jgi:hypothetical protein
MAGSLPSEMNKNKLIFKVCLVQGWPTFFMRGPKSRKKKALVGQTLANYKTFIAVKKETYCAVFFYPPNFFPFRCLLLLHSNHQVVFPTN